MASMPTEQIRRLLIQANAHPRRNVLAAAAAALLLFALLAFGLLTAAALAVGLIAGVMLAAGVGMPDSDATPAASVDPLPNPALIRHDEPDASITWRGIVEAVPNPVVAVDHDLIVIYANQAAHLMFPALRSGGPIALASRSPELAEALVDALQDRTSHTVQLYERVPVERRLDATVSPIITAGGRLPTLLIVMHDISERERLAQMRADFIAHASHELRTPLAALRGFIETLQGPAKDDRAAHERFLGIMSTEALRMTRILDDLLSLARVEMRANIAPTGRVGIKHALTDVVGSLEPLAESAETAVSVDLPEEERFVRGDRDEIVQVFVNLVQNAIKYGRRGGTVTVRVTDTGSTERPLVSIAVSDNGPGIAPEHLPRLTERFYRVDDRSSREKGGTGLGLAIVKHILNRHHGELLIHSDLGRGSTFTVKLPVAAKKS